MKIINLDSILKESFVDEEINEIVLLLFKHNMYNLIIKSIDVINSHISKESKIAQYSSYINITHISSSLITRINEYLRKRKEENKSNIDEDLKEVLGTIFRNILRKITDTLSVNQKQLFVLQLYTTFEEVCEINSYKLEELLLFIGVQSQVDFEVAKMDSDKLKLPLFIKEKIPGYSWEKEKDKFERFIEKIKHLNIADDDNLRKIKLLFSNPVEKLSIKLDEFNIEYILQLFAYLKDAHFFTHHSCRGFYKVLQYHVFNFDDKFLKGKPVNRRINSVKRLKTWEANESKFDKIFKGLV